MKNVPDPKDRRSNTLFITQQCRTVLAKINKMMNTMRPIALANLSTEEIEQLKENLLKIKGNLESHLTPGEA